MSEVLGALFKNLASLLGVASVALILYIVFGTSKLTTATTELTQLQTNILTLYSTQSSFATLTNTVAINGALAPTRMISGSSLVNPWSGSITVAVNAADSTRFDVTETKVPNDSCSKMATNTPSVVGLKINGATVSLPVDGGDAVNACNVKDNNTLTFTFSR